MYVTQGNGLLFKEALIKKYESEIAEAIATLNLYFTNSVGIGEHSEMLVEYDKWVEKLATAQDKLEALKKTFERPVQN